MVDEGTKRTLSSIPLLQTRASPRDKELWVQRLKEEYQALIKVQVWSFCSDPLFWKILFYFSMFKIIKLQTLTGSNWNQIKKGPNGLENAGTFTTYWNMSLTWNLMWVIFWKFYKKSIFCTIQYIILDSRGLSNNSSWDYSSRTGRKDCKNVSRW